MSKILIADLKEEKTLNNLSFEEMAAVTGGSDLCGTLIGGAVGLVIGGLIAGPPGAAYGAIWGGAVGNAHGC